MKKIEGIFPALYTPFDDEGELSEGSLRSLIDFQIEGGVHGLWLGGGSGEGVLLSLEERKLLVEATVEHVRGRVMVINHVGALTTRDAVELAEHSAQAGADAISSIPPFFYKPRLQEIVRHYRTIAGAVDLPLMAYHLPGLTGVDIDVEVLKHMMDVENFIGLKFSDYNLYELRRILELGEGRFTVIEGNDEVLLPALVMGAHGGVGMSYPIMPQAYVRMYTAYKAGKHDEAKKHQYKINRVIETVDRYGLAGYKAIMGWQGIECGTPRLPLRQLSTDELEQLKQELEIIGFFGDDRSTEANFADFP